MNAATLTKRFSLERSAYLLRNRLYEEMPSIGIGLGAIAALNAIGLVFSKRAWFNQGNSMVWNVILVMAGVLLAAQAFKGMHEGKSGTDWLLLPATPLEKYASAAIDYLVVFPLAGVVLAMGLSALLSLVERALGGSGGTIWTPFHKGALEAYLQYLVAASIFLAGSASFRKGAFLKTLAMAIAYGLAMTLLLSVMAWIVYKGRGFTGSNFNFDNGTFTMKGSSLPENIQAIMTWTGRIAWNALLPLFALVYGYFRVFEKEARDEVQ